MNPYIYRLVEAVLERPHSFEWTIQGFGMVRTYLQGDMRLNLWDSSLAVPGIRDSSIHTHPWGFQSLIVAGRLLNIRYDVFGLNDAINSKLLAEAEPHFEQGILTGAGGHLKGEPRPVLLSRRSHEIYTAGQTYEQRPEEVHLSVCDPGTITLNDRVRLPNTDDALVYWRGERWVTAEPRRANADEVNAITATCLEKLHREPLTVPTFATKNDASQIAMTFAPKPTAGVNPNMGHGHVYPRPDGVRMRCGGPGLCSECSKDAAQLAAKLKGGHNANVP